MFNIRNGAGAIAAAAGALAAYFNSPEIATGTNQLIVAAATGGATALALDIGFGVAEALTGLRSSWRPSALQGFGFLALAAGITYGGYELARHELTSMAVGLEHQRQQHTAPAPVQAAPRVSLRELESNGFRLNIG